MVFDNIVQMLARPYERHLNGGVGDARECVALVDLYIRATYTLVVADSRRQGEPSLGLVSTPGAGTMLAAIRTFAAARTAKQPTKIRLRIVQLATDVARAIDAFRAPPAYPSFKTLRDQLSHGQTLPTDDAAAGAVAGALRTLCSAMRAALSSHVGTLSFDPSSPDLTLTEPSASDLLNLNPLWTRLEEGPRVGLFSHFDSRGIYYLVPGASPIAVREADRVASFERDYLPDRRSDNSALGRFVRDVVTDVGAFTEDYSQPSYYFGDDTDTGIFFVPWTRSTSDENQGRVDAFRIGPNNEQQCRSADGAWKPYTSFLREISNWPLLARRVGIGLDQFAQQRAAEESARLRVDDSNVRGPARIVEVNDELQGPADRRELDLGERVDDACQLLKPSTVVFFLVGHAGLGKTDLMLSAARQRADLLAQSPEDPRPLYLFVSSTGRTLASLEDAVNGALNITKLLSSHSAKALCRNGMLVLFVDGFDELLGSSGYENALGSLEPWFRELGGRGVLVASARSSYYLTQYRRSLSETVGINADHTLAEIQPWSKQEVQAYLAKCGVPETAWHHLADRDWDLLGVPFFARAFAAWHCTHGSGAAGGGSIFDIVVEQYLHREAAKLTDPHQGQLLSQEELKEFFAEVAELMQQEKSRELELPDLVACAQSVIGTEKLDTRPGLNRRLTSLCGLGVQTGEVSVSKFNFSHEVMFDCFLSLALQHRVRTASAPGHLRRLLDKGKVQASVFDWMVEREPDAAHRTMERLMTDGAGAGDSSTLSENLGAWWMSLLKWNGGVPPTPTAVDLHLSDVELFGQGWTSLRLERCQVTRLMIPSSGGHRVSVPGTAIDTLECAVEARLPAVLSDVAPGAVRALKFGQTYVDTPSAVRSELERLGLVRPSEKANAADSQRLDAAEFFLRKLSTRVEVQVIAHTSDRLPDDHRLRWTKHLDDRAWLGFVDALERHGLARWEAITASGRPKSRLVFDVPPATIARRDLSDGRVRAFWKELGVAS